MKFIQDTAILALFFAALYFVAWGFKLAIDVQPRIVASAFEQMR